MPLSDEVNEKMFAAVTKDKEDREEDARYRRVTLSRNGQTQVWELKLHGRFGEQGKLVGIPDFPGLNVPRDYDVTLSMVDSWGVTRVDGMSWQPQGRDSFDLLVTVN